MTEQKSDPEAELRGILLIIIAARSETEITSGGCQGTAGELLFFAFFMPVCLFFIFTLQFY
jgi:hypothetical protein